MSVSGFRKLWGCKKKNVGVQEEEASRKIDTSAQWVQHFLDPRV